MAELMEWPCLDEYEKLVIRMNTPRSVSLSFSTFIEFLPLARMQILRFFFLRLSDKSNGKTRRYDSQNCFRFSNMFSGSCPVFG